MTAAELYALKRQMDDHPVAVIDIGSNSVRLVVFDGVNRIPRVMFNEKVLCGLGRDLPETGHLHAEGRKQAMATLVRFAALWQGVGVQRVIAVATAAVRDADDGPAFCEEARAVLGHPVRILSGDEEGIYSALGVVSGMPEMDGVIGDLGGGSLEFARIHGGQVHEVISLPLGPQRLPNPDDPHDARNAEYIVAQLKKIPWKQAFQNRPLIAVGGAWRSIARAHMDWESYPLHFIQGYRLKQKTALDISRVIALQSLRSALKMAGVSKRRLAALPPAALVLKNVIKYLKPSDVVFSAYGLREGLLYDLLDAPVKTQDPFLLSCQHLGVPLQRQDGYGTALVRWTAPIFEALPVAMDRLRHGACELVDIGLFQHPDYRPDHARDVVLRTPFYGLSHEERAFLALILWVRYGSRLDDVAVVPLVDMLGPEWARQAQTIGLAIRLAVAVSGGAARVLDGTRLIREGDKLRVDLKGHPEWHGEAVDRRLQALAEVLGLDPAAAEVLT